MLGPGLSSPGGTLHPITGHLAPRPLPAAVLWLDGLFAISAGAACGRALRQTSAVKREGRSHAEPEPGEPSPASGCLVHAGRDLSAAPCRDFSPSCSSWLWAAPPR